MKTLLCLAPALLLAACAAPPPAPAVVVSVPRVPSSALAAAEAPDPPPALSVVAEGARLLLGHTHGPMVLYDEWMVSMAEVDGERITPVLDGYRGLPGGAAGLEGISKGGILTGFWPDHAAVVVSGVEENPRPFEFNAWHLYVHSRQGWRLDTAHLPEWSYWREPIPWSDGQLLLSEESDHSKHRFVVLADDGSRRELEQPVLLDSSRMAQPLWGRLLFGRHEGSWALERWAPHDTVGVVTLVTEAPKVRDSSAAMCVGRDGRVRALFHVKQGTTLLSERQDGTWATTTLPIDIKDVPERCAVAGDGALWFTTIDGAKLFRRPAEGVLLRVPYPQLPPATHNTRVEQDPANSWLYRLVTTEIPQTKRKPPTLSAIDLVGADDGSIWLLLSRSNDGGRVVLRSGPPLPDTPIDWEHFAPGVLEARVAAWNAARGFPIMQASLSSDLCNATAKPLNYFATFASIPAGAPADVDFPSVRKLVKGRAELAGTTFVEVKVEGQRRLGALIPNEGARQVLTALMKGRIPGGKTEAFCSRPAIVRRISMGIDGE